MASHDAIRLLLTPRLDKRLDYLLEGIDLSSLSRISSSRIARTGLTHVASIESVSGSQFSEHYQKLYEFAFHGGEREKSNLIVSRLTDQFGNAREGLAPYHIVGLRDEKGDALGAAQFSVLFLSHSQGERKLVIPYLQYIYIRPSHQRQDLSEILHTLVLAVSMAEARKYWDTTVEIEVPYTLFETEPPVHGSDEALRAKAKERAGIHSSSGSIALMLRDPENDMALVSAHVQPGLELNDPPVILIWILRANPAIGGVCLQDQRIGTSLLAAYYQSLRDEKFPEENIKLAESMASARRSRGYSEFCLIEIGKVTKEMYVGIDGDDTSSHTQQKEAEL